MRTTMSVEYTLTKDIGVVTSEAAKGITEGLAKSMFKAAETAAIFVGNAAIDLMPGGAGTLARTWKTASAVWLKKGDGGVFSVGVFSSSEYAGIQNYGGTIKPKTARMLAVPISKDGKMKWPREWPKDKLQIVVNKKTNKVLLAEPALTKRHKTRYHYVLKRSVTLQGKHYLEIGLWEGRHEIMDILVTEAADQAFLRMAKVGEMAG